MCNIYGINAKVLTIFDTPSRIITGWTAIFYPKKKKNAALSDMYRTNTYEMDFNIPTYNPGPGVLPDFL